MPSDDKPSPLAGYPDVVTVPVQWGDQDAFGHVNNTVFLRWFEVGRISYLRLGMSHDATGLGLGPILAAVACNFRRQVTFPDGVRIGTRVARVGRSSLLLEHAIEGEVCGTIVADGTSTVVYYDYKAGESCPIPDAVRLAIGGVGP